MRRNVGVGHLTHRTSTQNGADEEPRQTETTLVRRAERLAALREVSDEEIEAIIAREIVKLVMQKPELVVEAALKMGWRVVAS